jgi:hypothetical protein
MENTDVNLKIQNECAAFAEKALRQIMARLRDGKNVSAHEEQTLRVCIKDCEEILALQARLRSIAESRETERRQEAKTLVAPDSPEQKKLSEVRDFVESVHAKSVNENVVALVFGWQKLVETKMLEWQWKYLQQARFALAEKQAEWSHIRNRCSQSGIGIWSKIRAYRLAGQVTANQEELAKESRRLSEVRAMISSELSSGKTLAGMAAVHLKLLKHGKDCEHRVIRKVLELDAEISVKAVLQEDVRKLEENLAATQQGVLELRESLMDCIGEHALCEEKKSQRMMSMGKKSPVTPADRMIVYTHKQIEKCYEPLHELVDAQIAAIQRDRSQKEKLKEEFSRLMGVVHEYQFETECEKEAAERSSRTSKGAEGTPRSYEGVCWH